MRIQFWSVGKAHEPYVKTGIDLFTRRITNYFPVEWKIIAPPKNAASLPVTDLKKAEGGYILQLVKPSDILVALDEKGVQFSSEQLSAFIQEKGNESVKQIIFLVGGAYGLDKKVAERANAVWSLSMLVFPHQLVRLILAEQIYRACTIMRNEKYHHS